MSLKLHLKQTGESLPQIAASLAIVLHLPMLPTRRIICFLFFSGACLKAYCKKKVQET